MGAHACDESLVSGRDPGAFWALHPHPLPLYPSPSVPLEPLGTAVHCNGNTASSAACNG
jgi:hypothetical protein